MNIQYKKAILIILLTLPLAFLYYEVMILQNINDPIKYIFTFTGVCSIVLILFSVLISFVKKTINMMKYRKIFGLFGFFYAFLHFLNFVILEAELSVEFIISETIEKPFIYLGMFSFLILLLMAMSSTKKMYQRYNKYHKLVCISILSFFIHTIMAQKSIVLIDVIFIITIVTIGVLKIYQYKLFLK